jgi:hypothetical protein
VIWKGTLFDGELIFENEYAESVQFTSLFSGAFWILTNIYAPCTDEGKRVRHLGNFRYILIPNITINFMI